MNRGHGYKMDQHNIYFIDWLNAESTDRFNQLASRFKFVKRIPIAESMAGTIKYCANISTTEKFWLLSSLTDYSKFDFNTEVPEQLSDYLQVFGAGTWFADRNQIKQVSENTYIEAFPKLHFVHTDLNEDKKLLDIVYISNGEPLAENHYQRLLDSVKTDNKIHRIDGINGRSAAYKAAATSSETAWFFTVFAKLEVDIEFDWTWRPDTIKGPKHYIFNALNPVNDLEYGHMAMIAYNKLLTLDTDKTGLDFVMTKPHDIVPIRSGIARFNQSSIVTWRTAFREALKLKHFSATHDSKEADDRLAAWLTKSHGMYGIWSVRGATDACEYYATVQGKFDKLMLSYDWAWLDQYFKSKYS